jgi:dTDP-4-dehydrorhamnose reductase
MSNAMWPTILLLGKNGQVGWELQRTMAPLGHVIAWDQTDLDLTQPDQMRVKLRELKPNLVVNAAAYTAVDRAEDEPDLAMAINGIAPGILAEETKVLGATLVHYSTDYVFDGTKITPYTEEDIPNPINVYGNTKLAGEQAIQAIAGKYLIFRTSWVYGGRGSNFLLSILRLANERDQIRVVDDQIGAPTWCRMIAEATALLLGRGHEDIEDKSGIYHLTAGEKTSWFGFAKAILASGFAQEKSPIELLPISSCEYAASACRPTNSLLSNIEIQKKFCITLPSWKSGLDLVIESMSSKNG